MRTHSYLFLAFAATFGYAALAQTSQTKNTPASSTEVIDLPEFSVSAEKDSGYGATDSLTGTRIAAKLGDLPLSVNVVTHDFIKDFNLFDLNQQLAFVSGYSPSDGQNNGLSSATLYQLRGFQSPTTLVDGFRRVGRVGEVNIDRIEVIKGTTANIYGSIVPGGVVNIITRQPTRTPRQEVDLSFGVFAPEGGGPWSDGANNEQLKHVTVSSSGPVNQSGTLLYRADFSYLYMPYGQLNANRRDAYGAVQLMYRPDAKTNVRLELEEDDLYDHPRNRIPQIDFTGTVAYQPARSTTLFVGTASPLAGALGLPADFHADGPMAYLRNRARSATLTAEHRFSDVWSIRASANRFSASDQQLYSTDAYFPNGPSASIKQPAVSLAPQWIKDPQNGTGYQIDSLINANFYGLKNKFLLTNDYSSGSKTQWDNSTPTTFYINPFAPFTPITGQPYTQNYPVPETNPGYFTRNTFNNWNNTADYGVFASDNLSFLKDRLFAIAGIRYDFLWTEIRNFIFADPITAATHRKDTSYGVHGWTHEYGLLGKVTPDISLFVNASSSFNPQAQLDQNANPLANNTANGVEFGVKTSLFSGRLNLSLLHFEVNEFDLARSTRDADNNIIVILTGQETAKGYEADLNWQPTSALQIFGGFGYTTARIVSSYGLNFLNNSPLPQVPRVNLGFGSRYTLRSGKLKGLYFTANEQYLSKSIISIGSGSLLTPTAAAPIINVPFPNGGRPYPNLPANAVVTSGPSAYVPDGRANIFNAPYALLGVGVGYSFKTQKTTQSISLQVSNVLNRYYTFGQAAPGNPRQIITSYSWKY